MNAPSLKIRLLRNEGFTILEVLVRAGSLGSMESIADNRSPIWIGLLFALAHVLVRVLSDRLAGKAANADETPRGDGRSVLHSAGDFFLVDALFLAVFLYFGLLSALVYRAAAGFWELFRGWPFRAKGGPLWFGYKLSMLGALIAIVVAGSEAGLHAYGLVLLTVLFGVAGRQLRSSLVKREGGGALNEIKVTCVLVLVYLIIFLCSEALWFRGGLEWWIWFFIFIRPIVILSHAFVPLAMLPFLKALTRAVHSSTHFLR